MVWWKQQKIKVASLNVNVGTDRAPQKLVVVVLISAHKKILEPWQQALKKHNIELVIQVTSPGEYFKRMQTGNYDLIVVPQVTGRDWCAVIKT